MEPRRHVLGPVTVFRIGFGAMQLPGPGVFGPPRDRDAAIAVLRRAADLGVDHIDTAHFYGPEVANELIQAALHPYPDGLALVSKVGAQRDASGAHRIGRRSPQTAGRMRATRRRTSERRASHARFWPTTRNAQPAASTIGRWIEA